MTTSGQRKRQGKVLSDHRRVGKRFIPPSVDAIGNLNEVAWVDVPLPELLWLGLLNEKHGLRRGAELGVETARAAVEGTHTAKKIWFAPISAYGKLSSKARKALVSTLRSKGQLDDLKSALRPLLALYPECPLAFMFEGQHFQDDPADHLNQLKGILAGLFDKTSKEATLTQASAIYIAFATDMLRVASHTSLAKFSEVADYPSTESQKVGAAVRALIVGFFGTPYEACSWPRYFWNRGLEIDECSVGTYE